MFFDNLAINHKRGPVIEEKFYYAFGMEVPGECTQAFKQTYGQNRYKFNGIEYDTAFSFDMYEAHFRDLDPVIGRCTTIDPKIDEVDESITPYASMGNNPVFKTDPLGDEPDGCCQEVFNWLVEKAVENPNGAAAVTVGIIGGAGNFAQNTVVGTFNAVTHPLDLSPQGVANNAVQMGLGAANRIDQIQNGSTIEKSAAITETVLDVAATVEGVRGGFKVFTPEPGVPNVKVGDYSNLKDSKSVGPGKSFTSAQKKAIIAENMKRNGGVIKSDKSGTIADKPVQSKKGVRANMNQAEVDHIKAKSKGGSNSHSNAQVLTKKENLDKSDN